MDMPEIFNVSALREITDGDAALEAELVGLFVQTAESCMERLKALVEQDVQDQWPKVVHELKGASGNIHADVLTTLCKKAEHAPLDVSRAVLLAEMQAAYSELEPQLKALL